MCDEYASTDFTGHTSPQTSERLPLTQAFEVISGDRELSAIHVVNQVMGNLSQPERKRVLTYLADRHGD